ncbi:hypothetical protein NQD34_015184 [Periophthalmus magnuspinnatus]|nr:hypothetical protein NQD34_015184 [Periophthalmus magnuspinnatus]
MDVFLVTTATYSSVLVLFQSVLAGSCPVDPGIFFPSLNLEGLSGSCLLIPCHFTVKEGLTFPGDKNAVAVWIKTQSQFETPNSIYVVFNSSRSVHVNNGINVTGKVSEKNCTTEFNELNRKQADRYFFRVEDGNFRSTASCSPINITVKDSPWSPTIEVSGKQTETEVVTITCSAVTPCPHAPPQLTWDLHQGTAHITETNADGTFTTKITHTLTLTSSHDGHNITCSAAYPANGGHKMSQTTRTLSVTREAGDVTKWLPVVIVLLVALIILIVLVWYFKFRRIHLQPAQVQTIEEVTQQEPAQREDSLHYGAVTFNSKTPPAVISSTQEDTVYSQVKTSSINIRAAAQMTDIYAQVQKT